MTGRLAAQSQHKTFENKSRQLFIITSNLAQPKCLVKHCIFDLQGYRSNTSNHNLLH